MRKNCYKVAFWGVLLVGLQLLLIGCGTVANPVSPYSGKIPTLNKKFTISYNLGVDSSIVLSGNLRSVAVSPDGKLVALGNKDDITLWNTADGSMVRKISVPAREVITLDFSSDSKLLAAGSAIHDSSIRIFEVSSGKELKRIATEEAAHRAVSLAFGFNDKKIIFSSSWANRITIWDIESGKLEKSFEGFNYKATNILSADNKLMITLTGDEKNRSINVFTVADGRKVSQFPQPEAVTSVIFNKKGDKILTTNGREQNVKILEINSGREVGKIDTPGWMHWVDTSLDDGYIYTYSYKEEKAFVQIWNASSLKEVAQAKIELPKQAYPIVAKGGNILAILDGHEGTLEIWEGIY